ncbi:hypothetical protein [Paenibacillus glycinis]|uniref:Uncharacterized protein n=1 Tax=Paenibacillus glycinis TaxID=2697035 RepID=A0ABW9XS92_9BACL|nr:hypothetical protein [Paenibacillus glycinis]NBD25214.1 hypothetical protein [Paenibacillus glycinis]
MAGSEEDDRNHAKAPGSSDVLRVNQLPFIQAARVKDQRNGSVGSSR